MLELRNHGQAARYLHTRIGINGRIDTLQAAILLAKLEVFDEELLARAEVADRYTAFLKDAVRTPKIQPDRTSAWAQYTIEVDDRETVENVAPRSGDSDRRALPHAAPPATRLCRYGLAAGQLSARGDRAAGRVLSLPMHPYLQPAQIQQISEAVKAAVGASVTRLSGATNLRG